MRSPHFAALDRLCVLSFAVLLGSVSRGQEPFLSYDFEDGDLGSFYNPSGMQAIDLCGEIYPAGEATVEGGEVLFTNDAFAGLTVMVLHPDVVAGAFPSDSRDYIARARLKLETVNEISFFVRSRMKIDDALGRIDAQYERAYSVSLFGQGAHVLAPDGALGIAEIEGCHEIVDHPEWPNGLSEGFGILYPGFPIFPGEWYEVEVLVQGDDDGGPVVLAAKVWPSGEIPSSAYSMVVTDPDGLRHTPETLDPSMESQISFGTSFDADQQPGATARMDDLSVTQLQGCAEAPVEASRGLWGDRVFAQGEEVATYEDGQEYGVSIALSDLRAEGTCPAPAKIIVSDRVPHGWTAKAPSSGGTLLDGDTVVRWEVDPSGGLPALSYTAVAGGAGLVDFQGQVQETEGGYLFAVGGEGKAAGAETIVPVSDFGSIQHWLILGPYTRDVGGANPGDAQIIRDYLTDGTVTEKDVIPRAGESIDTDFSKAASSGLAPDAFGRNPGGLPTWVEWRDYDDADDRIDFEAVYGPSDDVMCYAAVYLNVLVGVTVNFGVSSDDSVQVLLDGKEIDRVNQGRSALVRVYQDTPLTEPRLGNIELEEGIHLLLVKVFEGGGDHNFRVGFVDEFGFEIPGGLGEIEISLVPPEGPDRPRFKRGDSDASGSIDLTDAIFTLNFLFIGGAAPACREAANGNNDDKLDISDAVFILTHLFLGGEPPPDPGPSACGPDPDEAGSPGDLGCAEYTKC